LIYRWNGLVVWWLSFSLFRWAKVVGCSIWSLGNQLFGLSLFPNHSALVDRGCHQRATDWPAGMSFSCIHFNAMFIQVCLNVCENDAPKPNLSFRWLQLYQSYANPSTIIY
jgi:hypothetical protein